MTEALERKLFRVTGEHGLIAVVESDAEPRHWPDATYTPYISLSSHQKAVAEVWEKAIAVVKAQAFRWRHTNQIVEALEAAAKGEQ